MIVEITEEDGSTVEVEAGEPPEIVIEVTAWPQELPAVIPLPVQEEPAASPHLQMYAAEMAGRDMLTMKSPIGRIYQMQPALFGNFIGMIMPSRTTALTNLGMPHSNVGTISHPVGVGPDYQVYGRMAAITSPVAVNGVAAAYSTDALFFRGTVPTFGGWWSSCRVGTPHMADVRILVGLTSLGAVVYDLNGGAHVAAFYYEPSLSPNWHFVTKGGSTYEAQDTGIPVTVGEVYDCYSRCAPNGDAVEWQIDALNNPMSASGLNTLNLPTASALMRLMCQITSLEPAGAARVIRFQRMYIETDR